MIFLQSDEKIKQYCERSNKLLCLVRAGSSLHENDFSTLSDIDYFVVVETLDLEFVNDFPNRVSNPLDGTKLQHNLHSFYWKVTLRPVEGHEIHVHIYTKSLFEKYCNERSGPKMYLLHEHLHLCGEVGYLSSLRDKFKPDLSTARQDLSALTNLKYHHRFLWAWRSVALLRGSRWLRNKREIIEWVEKNYSVDFLDNKFFVTKELQALVNSHSEVSE